MSVSCQSVLLVFLVVCRSFPAWVLYGVMGQGKDEVFIAAAGVGVVGFAVSRCLRLCSGYELS